MRAEFLRTKFVLLFILFSSRDYIIMKYSFCFMLYFIIYVGYLNGLMIGMCHYFLFDSQ
jgi:hypothetical protein